MTQGTLLNVERARQIMQRDGLDALVATTAENVTYSTGYVSEMQWIQKDVYSYGILVREPWQVILVAPAGGLTVAMPATDRIIPFGSFFSNVAEDSDPDEAEQQLQRLREEARGRSHIEALAAALREAGVDRGRVSIDERNFPPQFVEALRERLPRHRVGWGYELFREIRMVKTLEEVRRLRRSSEIITEALGRAIRAASEGMSECAMAVELERDVVENGAKVLFTSVNFGRKTAWTNFGPTSRTLRAGDWIRFDVGCRYAYYCSDFSRSFCFGEPDANATRRFRAIVDGLEAAIEMVRPGVRAADVFDHCVDVVRRGGIPDYHRHHVGHGIGIEPYDPPIIGSGVDTVLQPGMVLCLETPYYQLGYAGLQVEDTVVVTADGYEILTRMSYNPALPERRSAEVGR